MTNQWLKLSLAINRYLKKNKVCFWWSNNPDITGILSSGKCFAILVASKDYSPSSAELIQLAEICKRGGIAFVARSVDDVKRHLEGRP